MYRFFLSLRYLRTRKTNWIGMAGILVAVGALITILSIMSGFLDLSRSQLRGSLADLFIQPFVDRPLEGGVPLKDDAEGMLEIVRAHPRVEAASVQLVWYGMLAPEGRRANQHDPERGKLALVNLVGIDFEDEYAASDLREALTREPREDSLYSLRVADVDDPFAPPPGYAPSGRPEASILLGEQLCNVWGLWRGQEIEIVTAIVDPETGEIGDPANQTFVVAGTFRYTRNDLDLERAYFDRRVLADWLGQGDPDGETAGFSDVLVKLKDYERDKVVVLNELYDELHAAGYLHDPEKYRRYPEIKTWEQFRVNLLKAIQNEKVLMGVMLSLVMVVAGFTVFAILSMMVTEKRRDIGIICALGGTPGGILTLFMMIAFWEALIGATLGTLTGITLALNIDSIEQWLSRLFGVQIFDRSVYMFDHIPAVIEVRGVAMIVLGAFACTLLFAAFPAWRAARLDPVAALRYE